MYLSGEITSFSAYINKHLKGEPPDINCQILKMDKQWANAPSPELYKERWKLQTEFNLRPFYQVESNLM